MSLTALANISATCEQGIKAAFIAQHADMDEASVFYNFFQVATQSKRKYPQIQLAAAPDIPQGLVDTTRKVQIACGIITHVADDPLRATLCALYGHVRDAIDAANAAPATWLSSYLPATWHFNGFMILDSSIPYLDDSYAVIDFSFEMEVCNS